MIVKWYKKTSSSWEHIEQSRRHHAPEHTHGAPGHRVHGTLICLLQLEGKTLGGTMLDVEVGCLHRRVEQRTRDPRSRGLHFGVLEPWYFGGDRARECVGLADRAGAVVAEHEVGLGAAAARDPARHLRPS